jgi:hypothetical protein
MANKLSFDLLSDEVRALKNDALRSEMWAQQQNMQLQSHIQFLQTQVQHGSIHQLQMEFMHMQGNQGQRQARPLDPPGARN